MIKSLWNTISSIGLDATVSKREGIKIKMLNQIAGVTFVTSCLLFIVTLILEEYPKHILIENMYSGLFALLIFGLHQYKHFTLSRNIACLTFPFFIGFIIIKDGGIIGQSKIFILCTILALIQYERQKKLQLFSLVLICLLYTSPSPRDRG